MTASNDDWLGDPSKSVVPANQGGVPTEEALRRELETAPVVPIKGDNDERSPQRNVDRDGVPVSAARRSADGEGDHGGAAGRDMAPPTGGDRRRPPGSRPHGEIWDDCPVKPLGVRGEVNYFLDAHGQLAGVKKLEAQVIQRLFSHRIPALCYNFPLWVQDPDTKTPTRKPGRFDQTAASMAMFEAAGECGLFNPDNAVRGVGAWADDDGQLVYHMGDRMLIGGIEHPPHRHLGHIYPAYPPIPHPAPPGDGPDPAADILLTLETWTWGRPDADPTLALGMIGVQMLGGALDWRPTFWVTGGAGSGKSELQKMFRLLHGDTGIVQSTDATKSGITSKLGHSSLPVALDEVEPGDARSNKERDLITAARVASSGGEWARGSSDQTGVGGKIFSAFLFSSILIPGEMKSQDIQRLVRFDLGRLPDDIKKLTLTPKTWRARGARLKRALIDRWPSWEARLSAWRLTLEQNHVTGRDADNWATVIAMADMAQRDEIADEAERISWARKIALYVKADRSDTQNDADAMLAHLMGQPFDIHRGGEQFSVAQWIMAAAGLPGAPDQLMGRDTPGDTVGDGTGARRERAKLANTKLAKAGLRVSPAGNGIEAELFIANTPNFWLRQLFAETDWRNGAWSQSAVRVPGATKPPHPLSLAGMRSRGTSIPLKSIPGLAEFPMDRDTGAGDLGRAAGDQITGDDFA